MNKTAIVWLRRDFRLHDNPALSAAVARGGPVLVLFILDEASDRWRPGGASRWWLHHSLTALDESLRHRGGRLVLRRGDSAAILDAVIADTGADAVYWNRRYDARGRALDSTIKARLRERGLTVESFNGGLLFEPWAIKTGGGGPFQVFTPFWRACLGAEPPAPPLDAPTRIVAPIATVASDRLETWRLLPVAPDWSGGLRETWDVGEDAARRRLAEFLDGKLANYREERDRPDLDSTSRLSPYLAWGEIGPRQVWHAAHHASAGGRDTGKFLSELGWREFSWHLLYHHGSLPEENFRPAFDRFPWAGDEDALASWQAGRTGYPIVDAGMRQLWRTGWMHNRVRMVVASFLVKHLLVHWRAGEEWFWDTLVDADLANNAASWQWVAGSGADAAPYFRIFNPVLQGERFDPDGDYVRRFVPELAHLPSAWIHKPWLAPASVLAASGVTLGNNYPRPIVEHDGARRRALAAFQAMRGDDDGRGART